MKLIFKKSQLKLNEGNSSLPPVAVMNSDEKKDNPTNLGKELSKVNQSNSNGSNVVVPTSQFTNKTIPDQNADTTITMPNNPDAASKIIKTINTSDSNSLPGMFVLQNGVERAGKLVEVATFKKSELDKFLKSL